MFALVDVNAFYASCETIFRPDLRGKPVVVLSNNDGCVIARSAEAKALNVRMGEPYFKLSQQSFAQRINVFSSNYTLYADMSHRVMTLLEEMAPHVEIYSIDEAFLNLSGMAAYCSLEDYGQRIRQRIKQEAHLLVGVGIAPTKTLAKLANYAAKKWIKTAGVVDLSSPLRQQKLLPLVPVDEVWGIGRRLSKKMQQLGIDTAADLAKQDTRFIRKTFSVIVERTVRELRGEPCLALEEFAPIKQQILCSRSFSQRITDYAHMREAVCSYAVRAAEKLRLEKQFCRQVGVFIRTSPHAVGEIFYANQLTGQLLTPSQDTRDIVRLALYLLEQIWRDGPRYMKAGIILGDFFQQGVAQLNLFDPLAPHANSEALMHVVDGINQSGKGAIWFAGQGIQKPWAMKREKLSPAYTTRYSDLPRVN
ncbi:translesion error-prone DNA polymerase V subunit UmuC [Tatumella sp. TA1]|uniref:translesion error-prone DNA polymerase V subunit UmuC n=1 Tax=Rosenbergiella collisarenosi TaxID=1544695 RepID=UPI0008F831E6|nr:translesion error-prone DNA polymerase V subunit UmuC [Rosenbergiella collisarenosi]MBT0720752.1 translesion error-prone DNA polymerase V subunit UmuC [Rosenbergiella collisarenosi]QGX91293.1 translesion error-prone DNA polymerase V subunit UmuC [Tatumella sp. TA1]